MTESKSYLSETGPLISREGKEKDLCLEMHFAENTESPLRRHHRLDGTIGLPQTIAHRGFKKNFPENTMQAFKGAIEAGSHAIETDLHLSRDGVVVISHDASLKRCFGVNEYILNCDWEYLSTLRTLRDPNARMPRLIDLLEYIASPGLEDVWIILDIKLDNDPKTIMTRIAETVKMVPPGRRPWHEKIVLGCWSPDYFPLCSELLPKFPVVLICFNLFTARRILHTVPRVSFSIFQKVLMGPMGYRFLEDVRADNDNNNNNNRTVFVWTVNQPRLMRWCIRKGVDGVITDDPETCRRICDSWSPEEDAKHRAEDRITVVEQIKLAAMALFVVLFGWTFKYRHLRLQRLIVEDSAAAAKKPSMKQGYPETE